MLDASVRPLKDHCTPPLPRGLLRHLLVTHRIGPGARVLDVGCGCGELVRFLDRLGINAAGADAAPEAVDAARRMAPHLEFHSGLDGLCRASGIPPFDLILVRGPGLWAGPYAASLLEDAALACTGALLSRLRPAGTLAFVTAPDDSGRTAAAGHRLECCREHLLRFRGETESRRFSEGLLSWTWSWTAGLHRRREVGLATLRIPHAAIAPGTWTGFAAKAVGASQAVCCPASEGAGSPTRVRRPAA